MNPKFILSEARFFDKISKKQLKLEVIEERIKVGLKNTFFIVLDWDDIEYFEKLEKKFANSKKVVTK